MNREQQIEEMARILCGYVNSCTECYIHKPCLMNNCAIILTEKGYRKATDVAREIFAEIESMSSLIIAGHKHYIICELELAELKKKYTESEKYNGKV